jgi:hypothetical protein
MAIAQNEHPSTVAVYEVRHRRGREGLALFGALVFVAGGLWMMLDADTGAAEKAAGGLAVAFFGWCAVVIVLRMRRGAAVRLSHEGIHYAFAPNYETRKLIRWHDIEGFGIARVQSSEFNFVRLSRYGDLVREFSERDATQTVKIFRRLMRFGGAAVIVAGANLEFDKAQEAADLVGGSGTVTSIDDMLRFSRKKFGGEICLGWPDRDRSAARFHELLTVWKDHCTA